MKGGDPAAPSDTATLVHDFTPINVPPFGGWLLKGYLTDFGCFKLSWCDGRGVQGLGTYSPRHALIRDYSEFSLHAVRADCDPGPRLRTDLWDWLHLAVSAALCSVHCSGTCVAQVTRGMMI